MGKEKEKTSNQVKQAAKKKDITINEVMSLCSKYNLDRALTYSIINLYWSTRK